jgi:hypothetical protein
MTADMILAGLQDPDRCTPAMLQAALRFLADNQIQVVDDGTGKLSAIFQNLPFPKTGTDG